jgi:tRNA G18 (ribose-2'-O)-methylase SpoU
MTRRRITLAGDGIENPHNARALLDAGALFGTECVFRDRAGLQAEYAQAFPEERSLPLVSLETLRTTFGQRVALENVPGANSVYGARIPAGDGAVLIAGNERRGLARETLASCERVVQIPLASGAVSSLNVAAAAAVGLYYLSRGPGGPQRVRPHPAQHRPEVLLLSPSDHVETGSAIRSAAAFGWGRVLLEDTHSVWFGAPRPVQAEARAAARRHKNAIHVVPAPSGARHAFDEVCVVTAGPDGTPLHAANLARGPRQLIVLPDTSAALDEEDWSRFAPTVRFVRLDLSSPTSTCRYRLLATIALAEIARQAGRPSRLPVRSPGRKPLYDAALPVTVPEAGEILTDADLEVY